MDEENKINRKLVLDAMILHETITEPDLALRKNLGVPADAAHLRYLLTELRESGHLQRLPGVIPVTFTVTQKGIDEGARLEEADKAATRRPGSL